MLRPHKMNARLPCRCRMFPAVFFVFCRNRVEFLVEHPPDKAFGGRISRGLDFLGYRFQATGPPAGY